MKWRFWNDDSLDLAERARREHSEWLTRAMASSREYPRIPVRPVVTGGFSRLLSRGNGAELARRWWEAALARME